MSHKHTYATSHKSGSWGNNNNGNRRATCNRWKQTEGEWSLYTVFKFKYLKLKLKSLKLIWKILCSERDDMTEKEGVVREKEGKGVGLGKGGHIYWSNTTCSPQKYIYFYTSGTALTPTLHQLVTNTTDSRVH